MTVSFGSLFHSVIVLGKRENLKYSLCPFGAIKKLKSWLPGVLLSLFGIKWSSHFPSRKPRYILYITDSLVCLLMHVSSVSHFKGTICVTWPGSHNPERATPILDLCHGAFTDQFIFRHILWHLFSAKIESPPCLWAHSKYKISNRKTKCY